MFNTPRPSTSVHSTSSIQILSQIAFGFFIFLNDPKQQRPAKTKQNKTEKLQVFFLYCIFMKVLCGWTRLCESSCCLTLLQVVQLCWDGKKQASKPLRGLFCRLASLPLVSAASAPVGNFLTTHPLLEPSLERFQLSGFSQDYLFTCLLRGLSSEELLVEKTDFMPASNKEAFLQPGLSNHFLLCELSVKRG